jgi:hypothetical protein
MIQDSYPIHEPYAPCIPCSWPRLHLCRDITRQEITLRSLYGLICTALPGSGLSAPCDPPHQSPGRTGPTCPVDTSIEPGLQVTLSSSKGFAAASAAREDLEVAASGGRTSTGIPSCSCVPGVAAALLPPSCHYTVGSGNFKHPTGAQKWRQSTNTISLLTPLSLPSSLSLSLTICHSLTWRCGCPPSLSSSQRRPGVATTIWGLARSSRSCGQHKREQGRRQSL